MNSAICFGSMHIEYSIFITAKNQCFPFISLIQTIFHGANKASYIELPIVNGF